MHVDQCHQQWLFGKPVGLVHHKSCCLRGARAKSIQTNACVPITCLLHHHYLLVFLYRLTTSITYSYVAALRLLAELKLSLLGGGHHVHVLNIPHSHCSYSSCFQKWRVTHSEASRSEFMEGFRWNPSRNHACLWKLGTTLQTSQHSCVPAHAAAAHT